jgi:hypothetical protein
MSDRLTLPSRLGGELGREPPITLLALSLLKLANQHPNNCGRRYYTAPQVDQDNYDRIHTSASAGAIKQRTRITIKALISVSYSVSAIDLDRIDMRTD